MMTVTYNWKVFTFIHKLVHNIYMLNNQAYRLAETRPAYMLKHESVLKYFKTATGSGSAKVL